MTGTLHEDLHVFVVLSLSYLLVEREIFEIKFVEKIKTNVLGSATFYKNRSVYEMTGKIWHSRTGRS